MRRPRIHAIDHVHLDVPPGCGDRLREFYGSLLGLPALEPPAGSDAILCFGANRLQLKLLVRERPDINPNRRRLVLEVESLRQQAQRFDDAGVPYRTYRGFRYTEQRVFVDDPAGHVLELKQVWPF